MKTKNSGCYSSIGTRVIDEIKRVKNNYKIDFVRFGDDVFTYRLDDWIIDFCKKYKKEINLPCVTWKQPASRTMRNLWIGNVPKIK